MRGSSKCITLHQFRTRRPLTLYGFLYDKTVNPANHAYGANHRINNLPLISTLSLFESRPTHQNILFKINNLLGS